ncbi:MAG: alpha/beta hydrolase-fold protein [Opitutaceae bacterium]|nr:alpha/beta hydrolase-fold protein [Opitutaceae bacterium]
MSSDAFRTIEISDPQYETEELREVTVKSSALGGRGDITLHVPRVARTTSDVPLIILLHGVYGSHWAWVRKAGAHRIASQLQAAGKLAPCVLAMPSDGLWGDGSGYLPHRAQNFERWIVEDVVAAARLAAPSVTERSHVCIAGLSMGGFGALRLAAKFPNRFVAAAGLSSITHFNQMARFVEEPLDSYAAPIGDHSILETMQRHRRPLPALRFDCGIDDPLLEANRELHTGLDAAGIAHQYAEYAGGHNWDYWTTHLPEMLLFFAHVLSGDHQP